MSPADENPIAFEHYRVMRQPDGAVWELGRGAMGVTYKAIDDNLHMVVALKVINALLVDKESARERFLREARAAASLKHRNVASVFHLGRDTQSFFYAMEFIDGETVEALVRRSGRRPWREALGIALQVTRALQAAHDKRLVHRDIKPANLMLVAEADEPERVVKVIDFGLAKTLLEDGSSLVHTHTTGFIGTPLFASPEQCNEETPDIRSDIYSLGVTLWFMLAGQAPFQGTLVKVLSQHVHAEPPWDRLPPDPPEPVRQVLARMLAKNPAARPQTPLDLRRELEGCLRESPAARTWGSIVIPPPPEFKVTTADLRPDIPPIPPPIPWTAPATWPPGASVPFPAARPAGARWGWIIAAGVAALVAIVVLTVYLLEKQPGFAPPAVTGPATPAPPSPADAPDATPAPAPVPEDHLAQASGWIDSALVESAAISNASDRAASLARIGAAQVRAGLTEAGQRNFAAALQRAESTADSSSTSAKSWTVSAVAIAQARSGDVAGAKQTLRQVTDTYWVTSALTAIGIAQVKAGDRAGARRTFEAARDSANANSSDLNKVGGLCDLAVARFDAGDVAEARQIADAARQIAEAMTKESEKAFALRLIAILQARMGNVREARQTVEKITLDYYQTAALAGIVAAQARAGDVAGAQQALEKLATSSYKASAQRAVATAQAKAGDVAGARRTADAIHSDPEKPAALCAIAAAQARAGDFDAADATVRSLASGKFRCQGYLAAANALVGDASELDDE